MLDLSNKLAAGEYGTTNKTGLDEEPDLEVAPVVEAFPPGIITNQQEGHNGESCLNVTKKDKKHWSSDEKKQDQSTKPSDEGGPTIHNLPPADYEVINILGEIELKIATFEQKFSSMTERVGELGSLQIEFQNIKKTREKD